jgi:hypothetical protein
MFESISRAARRVPTFIRIASLAATILLTTSFRDAAAQTSTVDALSPVAVLSPVHATVDVPVTLTRTSTTPMVGFSVEFTLSSQLSLAAGTSSVVLGPFITAQNPVTDFRVVTLGPGHYRADGVTLGSPCGSTALTGTLFTVAVANTVPSGSGTLTLNKVVLRDCENVTLPSAIGTAATVAIDHVAPTLSLSAPNGGETWAVGSAQTIVWSATDASGVAPAGIDLELSTNDGASWSPIATGLANTGSYAWTVPASVSTTARVRVTARDIHTNTAVASSASAFTIAGTTATSVSSSGSPSILGAAVSFSAHVAVTGGSGTPTGSVQFSVDGLSFGTPVGIDGSGNASSAATTSLTLGSHTYSAAYSGSASFLGSASTTGTQVVRAQIVVTAGPNGTITPAAGTYTFDAGATPSFAFAASSGHHVAAVTVDGGAAPLTSPYTFAVISANHTLDVQFAVNPPVAGITDLTAVRVRTGNDASGTTKILLNWTPTPAGTTVEVYRAGFGNYPSYDDGPTPGSVPPTPAYPPAGRWTLTGIGSPATTDHPSTRDFVYYVAFVTDVYGTHSAVSNVTTGALDYSLGDVSDGVTLGHGDNLVNTIDITLLGAHYGSPVPDGSPVKYLDVGPTTDLAIESRPTTDGLLDFEDLVVFALNYGGVSVPQAIGTRTPALVDELQLDSPAHVALANGEYVVTLRVGGTGHIQALSTHLSWDPAIVEPVDAAAGEMLAQQHGVMLSARPGSVDAAILGTVQGGVTGSGVLATVRFRVRADGDPRISIGSVDARDAQNHPVSMVTSGVAAVSELPVSTGLMAASPNPSRQSTTVTMALAHAGQVDVAVYGVDGRRVRTLEQGVRSAGLYRVQWDGRDDAGRMVAPGMYFARLLSSEGRFSRAIARVN